jgi:hypothetical protein
VIERAIERIEYDVRIESGSELAVGDASADDLAGNLTSGEQPVLDEGLAQALINLGAPDQRSQDLSLTTAERSRYEAHGRLKALAGGGALLDRRGPSDVGEDRIRDNRPYIGPTSINRRLADASPRGDALNGLGVESQLHSKFQCSF